MNGVPSHFMTRKFIGYLANGNYLYLIHPHWCQQPIKHESKIYSQHMTPCGSLYDNEIQGVVC
jgi:hypothetical protein